MIRITRNISLRDNEIACKFIRASGPGGQNVNKLATAVQLRFEVTASPSLPEDVRARLVRLAGKRMSASGTVVIDARRFRTQARNRQDAIERLGALIRKAAAPPKPRKATRPPAASRQHRLHSKHHRAERKRRRKAVEPHADHA